MYPDSLYEVIISKQLFDNSHTNKLALYSFINTLHAELHPICHLLPLLRAHPTLHISRV